MRIYKYIGPLIFSLILGLASLSAQEVPIELAFFDACTTELVEAEYEWTEFEGLPNEKVLKCSLERGINWELSLWIVYDLKQKKDTIVIPQIVFAEGKELNDRKWAYLNCDHLCEGLETDYYANGEKRLEGTFQRGKPEEIRYFREDGTMETEEFFILGTLNYSRINYFDDAGLLQKYERYRNTKKKTLIKTYDRWGKLLEKVTERHVVEN
ncbi:MAG: hypothetical protein AAF694_18475 [Bacteroidota bacterium]